MLPSASPNKGTAQNGVPAVTRGAATAHPRPVPKGSVGQPFGRDDPNHGSPRLERTSSKDRQPAPVSSGSAPTRAHRVPAPLRAHGEHLRTSTAAPRSACRPAAASPAAHRLSHGAPILPARPQDRSPGTPGHEARRAAAPRHQITSAPRAGRTALPSGNRTAPKRLRGHGTGPPRRPQTDAPPAASAAPKPTERGSPQPGDAPRSPGVSPGSRPTIPTRGGEAFPALTKGTFVPAPAAKCAVVPSRRTRRAVETPAAPRNSSHSSSEGCAWKRSERKECLFTERGAGPAIDLGPRVIAGGRL